ncbi:MAG: hypothetical protein ABSH36_02390 [Solirubrobacteraceae bacterium]
MPAPPSPQTPRLPSRRVGAILATAMLAVGIAMGALIGPGPADSLANSSRAAAIGRVLALLALGSGTNSGGNLALSSGAANPPASAPQPTAPSTSEATARNSGGSGGGAGVSSTPSHASTSPSSSKVSPTSSTTPTTSGEEKSEKKPKAKPLPPIADAWVIELPYGSSLENALKQSAAAPYLDGQLKAAGTMLSGYSSLAAAQLAGAATLLSGQVGATVTTVAPPPCGTSAPAGAASGAASSPTAGAPTSSTSQPAAACPAGEPAGVQAADAFLQEVVPAIEASTAYKEHGLIVITFGAAGQQGASSGTTTGPLASTTVGTGTEVIYPAGSIASTLTAAGAPAGALLISPFLSHAGTRSTSAFNPLAPHESLAALFRAKAAG